MARKPLGAIGAALVLLLLVVAAAAPVISPYSYDVGNAAERLQGPTLAHPFGTDANGRDMLSRIIWGAQISVTVGFGAVAISTLLAVTIGIISGYFGGSIDLLVQRLVDIWISFPTLVLLISLVAVAGPGLWSVTGILGILLAPGTSRVVRSAVISIRHLPYIESASCIGAGHPRVILKYVLPNVFAPIIVLATVQLGTAILAESTLSFLGYGVQPPRSSWGNLLATAEEFFGTDTSYLIYFPGLAILATVLAINLVGDRLRDAFDPRI
jgi:peptide/nickel transport system permease protein